MVTFLRYTIFAMVGHEIRNPHIHLAMWIFSSILRLAMRGEGPHTDSKDNWTDANWTEFKWESSS